MGLGGASVDFLFMRIEIERKKNKTIVYQVRKNNSK